MRKKKIWANFQRIIELFTQKFVTKLSKIWVRDPGSGKTLFRRIQGQKGTGSRILDPYPQDRNTDEKLLNSRNFLICSGWCLPCCTSWPGPNPAGTTWPPSGMRSTSSTWRQESWFGLVGQGGLGLVGGQVGGEIHRAYGGNNLDLFGLVWSEWAWFGWRPCGLRSTLSTWRQGSWLGLVWFGLVWLVRVVLVWLEAK
jgi:hypothetical protein